MVPDLVGMIEIYSGIYVSNVTLLVNLKDQTPLNQGAVVIYKIPFGDCLKVYLY